MQFKCNIVESYSKIFNQLYTTKDSFDAIRQIRAPSALRPLGAHICLRTYSPHNNLAEVARAV